ncbi:MAG: GNAT family N-acetyltransferase [Methanosarcina sp.]
MTEEIIMRIAESQDVESLRELIHKTIDKCYFFVYPQEAIDYFKDYHNRTNILNDIFEGHCLILACRQELIGTGTLLGSNARRVFVKPEYQKMGLGKRIMDGLEEKAMENGVRIMDLDASLVASFLQVSGIQNTGRGCDSSEKWTKLKILQNGEKLKRLAKLHIGCLFLRSAAAWQNIYAQKLGGEKRSPEKY